MSAQLQCSCCRRLYIDLQELPLDPPSEGEALTWICRSCLRDPVHVIPCHVEQEPAFGVHLGEAVDVLRRTFKKE